MKSLYRKYRPTKLEEVVGQSQVTEPLIGALKTGKIGHAYLFVGPRGCGKTSVARIIAHEVNGFKYEIEDDYVDIIEIDGASNRGIDNIRELREKVAIAPTSGKYKVYIIDEVHMLTKEAFNALLKTLEEPPEHVIFIMATTDAYKVPVTITSRAQTFTFKLADKTTMLLHLRKICDAENIKIDDAALEVIVRRGGGSFRDSLSLLDQISTLSDSDITKEAVLSALGLPNDDLVEGLLKAYLTGDNNRVSKLLQDLLASGTKAETLVSELIEKIITEPKAELMELLGKLPDVKAPYAEAKLLVALYKVTRPSATVAPRPTATSKPTATQVLRPTTQSTPAAQTTQISDFSWDGFLERVKSQDPGIGTHLKSCRHEIAGDTLNIYPEKGFIQKTLERDKNKAILIGCASGLKVAIRDASELKNINNDALISKMSAIMGGEVINDGGNDPF